MRFKGTRRDLLTRLARPCAAVALLALCLCSGLARGADAPAPSLPVEILLDPADVTLHAGAAGTAVELPGGVLSGRPGEPALPGLSRGVELPAAMVATALRVVAVETDTLSVGDLIPVDRPVIPALTAPGPTAGRDERIYGSADPFPPALAELEGTSWTAGATDRDAAPPPDAVSSRAGRLLVHTRITVEVFYEPAPRCAGAGAAGARERMVRASWLLSSPTAGTPAAAPRP